MKKMAATPIYVKINRTIFFSRTKIFMIRLDLELGMQHRRLNVFAKMIALS